MVALTVPKSAFKTDPRLLIYGLVGLSLNANLDESIMLIKWSPAGSVL